MLEFRLLKRSRNSIIAQEVKRSPPITHDLQARSGEDGAAMSSGKIHSTSRGSVLDSLHYNRFAKFTQVEEASLLWAEAAEQLASHASQVSRLLCDTLK